MSSDSEQTSTHPVYVNDQEKRQVKAVAGIEDTSMRAVTEAYTRLGRLLGFEEFADDLPETEEEQVEVIFEYLREEYPDQFENSSE